MTTSPKIEVRNLKFDVDSQVPRYWHGGRKAVTIFLDNLSIFFPAGERFFIASVKAHTSFVRDERLLAETKAFCAQEGIHSREHIRYNEMLSAHGYPVKAMERRVERLLARVTKVAPPRERLAATAALEHFTALLAHLLLSNPRLLAGAHPVMAALWRWHAAEENEHKAVAYDVFRQAGGTYSERIVAMMFATVIFWAKVFEHQVRMMWVAGVLFSLREWYSLFRFLFIDPGGITSLMRPYLDYYRPSFHPWNLDNRDLLEAWKSELQASPMYEQPVLNG